MTKRLVGIDKLIPVISGLLLLELLALHSSIAAMEFVSWISFACIVAYKLTKRSKFTFPLVVPLLSLVAIVGISLLINPPLRPFLIQFGFMRWVILLWSFTWGFEIVWNSNFEKRFIKVWVGALLITSAYAAFESLTGIDFIHPSMPLEHANGLYRAKGFFSLTLTFAYMIGISFLSIIGPSKKLGSKWFYTTLILGGVGVASSLSRGPVLAALIGGFFWIVMKARAKIIYFVPVAILILFGLSRVLSRLNDLFHLRVDRSSEERLHLWRAYWEMFRDKPFTGIGIFQGDKLLPEYYARLGITEDFYSHAHNVPLQWLAGSGILALLIYLGISCYFLRASWRLTKWTQWGWSILVAQIFWHLGSLTETNFFDAEVNHFIVFTWALTLALTGIYASQKTKRS